MLKWIHAKTDSHALASGTMPDDFKRRDKEAAVSDSTLGSLGSMPEHCVVYVTASSEGEARTLANALVSEGLAACVNRVGPIQSSYLWQGELHDDSEYLLIAKTRRSLVESLGRRVKELHSYDLPELIALPIVAGLPAYLDWIASSTAAAQDSREAASPIPQES